MKTKLLESAKEIVKQGNCNTIQCDFCPSSHWFTGKCCKNKPSYLGNTTFFKNYIEENEDKCLICKYNFSGICHEYLCESYNLFKTKEKPIEYEKCEDCIKYEECLKIGCRDFKPKENPIENKVIFESDDQVRKVLREITILDNDADWYDVVDLKTTIKNLKEKGYIRKSTVEEAEEMYLSYKNKKGISIPYSKLENKLYEALQEQKEIIERLKK